MELCHKRGDVRETGKTSNDSSGGIEDILVRRWSNFGQANAPIIKGYNNQYKNRQMRG